MRLINLDGRIHLVTGDGVVDVAKASEQRFGPDPQDLYQHWDAFQEWARTAALPAPSARVGTIGSPAPLPRQVFAVGLNYDDHATESGLSKPEHPVIFTKFVSSITGPVETVQLPAGSVDWEVELVVVMGRGGRNIPEDRAWEFVAGVSVGQDLSERDLQLAGPAPQFSLAKSHAGFSPIGPELVTVDELPDPDDLELGAEINGETVQHSRTSQLIFPVSNLIAYLSDTVELYPGDVIFTGTPSGVGMGRNPKRFLAPGDELRTYITGVGEFTQRFVTADSAPVAPRS
ncbi:fumarylacetoacetate hydrolase family protein [Mycolicibacterium smegmatis]|uniref:fumarylacetoacetate hydrolase family protein n=1 Tax=Mycolicibacterium smegmatis TaxID=1772 RepID=UPI001E557257|nr:fumarylacetoacetate hydrolase family protein [Mycolicibacterium smegmatis]UGU31247.1 fumarylacetoacetate hydrolase family protein [Mycolicibacterium smegmatis]ULN72144.1 fumarylacetoacetate hydrolase family protein [Mycolicibacterium smegmatis]